MNHRLKGRTLLHGDFDSPDIAIAEFSKVIDRKYVKEMVTALNHGDEMLRIYQQHRDNLHITNIVPMLERMESVFHRWERDLYAARREK
jgi:predicted regulator of amino acid metabolism with ACT domain